MRLKGFRFESWSDYKKIKIMNLNTATAITIIVVSFFIVITIGLLNEKDVHDKRMDLIEEQSSLVRLRKDIELEKMFRETDSLLSVIDAELNKK
jgi:hypothetical protein